MNIPHPIPTPHFIFDESSLRRNATLFRRQASLLKYSTAVNYSVKTNPILGLLEIISDSGLGFVVSSGIELSNTGRFHKGKIVFDSPIKSEESIAEANRLNATIIFDNISQIALLKSALEGANTPTLIGIRVAVPPSISGFNTRFGIDLDELDFQLIKQLLKDDRFGPDIESLQFHFGKDKVSVSDFEALARFSSEVWNLFLSHGVNVRSLDLGGGFPMFDTARDIKPFLDKVEKGMVEGGVDSDVELRFQPGKAIVQRSGTLVVKVIDIVGRFGKSFILVDGGSNLIMPMWMRNQEGREVNLIAKGEGKRVPITDGFVIGPLCAETDYLTVLRGEHFVSCGDILEFEDVGAYDWSTMFAFGDCLPPAFLKCVDGSTRSVRPMLPYDLVAGAFNPTSTDQCEN